MRRPLALLLIMVAAAQAAPKSVRRPAAALEPRWQVESGAWSRSGSLVLSEGEGDNTLSCSSCTDIDEGLLAAFVTPARRCGPGAWAAAGVVLFQDMQNYWRLAVVEGPDGQRYCELVEMLDGVWQAQSMPGTLLTGEVRRQAAWEYGRRYRFTISMAKGLIRGQITDAGSGRRIFDASYPVRDDVEVVAAGTLALNAVGMRAAFEGAQINGVRRALRMGQVRRAAVVAGLPGSTRAATIMAAKFAERCGFEAVVLGAEALESELRAGGFRLLIVPWAKAFPAAGRRALLGFLKGGGRLLVLGPAPFENWVLRADGAWLPRERVMSSVRAAHSLVDFAKEDLSAWLRSTDSPSARADREVIGSPHGSALRVRVDRLTGWDTLEAPAFAQPFPPGHSVTCFWAKGSKNTRGLLVEWREADGSRWIATVSLSQEWKHFALAPRDFHYWRDSPAKNRGGPGDLLNTANAQRLSFGIAHSHLAGLGPGEHEYSVAAVGTAPDPAAGADLSPLVMEALSPWHKYYDVHATGLRLLGAGAAAPVTRLPHPVAAKCCIPRSRGGTYSKRPPGRWLPILEAKYSGGDGSGSCGWAYFPFSGPYRGSGWACVAVGDSAWAERNFAKIAPAVEAAIRVLARDLTLARAGSTHWCYFPGEGVQLGAEVRNMGARPCAAVVRWTISRGGRQKFSATARLWVEAGGAAIVESRPWKPLAAGLYTASARLMSSGVVHDVLEHEFRVLAPPAQGRFVQVKGGRFQLGGKPWCPHGINFWPRYVAGLPVGHYFGHWLSPDMYDSAEVEKDLALLARLGANVVSVQLHARDQVRPLNDFLARAAAHGIKANVFLAGAHPIHTDERLVTDLIRAGRLAQSDAIFAYDIAWEPRLGRHAERRALNRQWNRWIDEQYGSLKNAVADWGFEPQVVDGLADGPTDDQLRNDGPWRVMVAAYRRFADDYISRRYGRIVRLIRKLDPNHLIGARTGFGGTGQAGVVADFPYDLVSGARHLDFVSPEGWGLAGPWPEFRTAGFTTAYGRWASNGKPVFWSEFGATIYPGTSRRKIAEQGRIYQHMYRMLLESGANGSAGWWFPGGLRVDENSDFGIVNPDGSLRPAAVALQAFAPRMKQPRPQHDAVRIVIDRDLHPGGYWMVWERAKEQYLQAVRKGKGVEVVTEATGTTTADMPIVAIGNRPYRRSNPLKYVNAEFNFLRIKDASGKWQDVEDGSVVKVKAGENVMAWASVANTGEATWLSGTGSGKRPVVLIGWEAGEGRGTSVEHDVPRYGNAEMPPWIVTTADREHEISFRMWIGGLGRFGEERRVRLVPMR